MEWFGHNPDQDWSKSNGEEDVWSAGKWEDRVQAGLDVSKETSLDRGPQFCGVSADINKGLFRTW
jgi:hypothetical protein